MCIRSYDVLIIGAGVVGASIFHSLTRAGYGVALIERGRVGMGCTSWSGGVVRCFHLDRGLAEKAVFGWQYYREFGVRTGIECPFVTSGFLYFPPESRKSEAIEEARYLADFIPIQWLSRAALNTRFGGLLRESTGGAAFESDAGYMNPLDVTRAWVRAAQLQGGDLFEGAEVQRLAVARERFAGVVTNLGDIKARQIVIATGPHTPQLLDRLEVPHDLYAQAIQVDLRRPRTAVNQHPAFLDDEFGIHGRPCPEAKGIYIGLPTNVRGPESLLQCSLDARHCDDVRRAGVRRWQWVEGSELAGGLRSADCYSADGLGRVIAVDHHQSLLVATGFNGGAFKMAPWIGHEITRLINNAP